MTTRSNRVFVDTNVLAYASLIAAPLHLTANQRLDALWNGGAELWTSRQVFREFLAAVTRSQSFSQPLPMASAIASVVQFQKAFVVAEDGAAVMNNLLALCATIPPGAGRCMTRTSSPPCRRTALRSC
jgi:predicted nucleic acid-binding protein